MVAIGASTATRPAPSPSLFCWWHYPGQFGNQHCRWSCVLRLLRVSAAYICLLMRVCACVLRVCVCALRGRGLLCALLLSAMRCAYLRLTGCVSRCVCVRVCWVGFCVRMLC